MFPEDTSRSCVKDAPRSPGRVRTGSILPREQSRDPSPGCKKPSTMSRETSPVRVRAGSILSRDRQINSRSAAHSRTGSIKIPSRRRDSCLSPNPSPNSRRESVRSPCHSNHRSSSHSPTYPRSSDHSPSYPRSPLNPNSPFPPKRGKIRFFGS